MPKPPRVLVVDDDLDAREILTARFEHEGFEVTALADGMSAVEAIARDPPDVLLLDVMMPGLDGLETLARIKAANGPFVPTILVTAKGEADEVIAGLDRGADEYVVKPFDHAALTARVRAMLRQKALHDRLEQVNASLQQQVADKVEELQRASRLTRFLAPQVVEEILRSDDPEAALASHRRDVAVLFCDLRGFTAFAETSEPEDLMAMLSEYHEIVGQAVFEHQGTLERFTGDSVMAIFNDPVDIPDYRERAVALASDLVGRSNKLTDHWNKRAANLGIGVGVAAGFATLGKIGFKERYDYAAVGSVTNLAARLSQMATSSQILTDGRIAEVVSSSQINPCGLTEIAGFGRRMAIFELHPSETGD